MGAGVAQALDVGHLGAFFEGLAFGGHRGWIVNLLL
jgi:hypothetical protein